MYYPADLDDRKLKELKALESELGKTVVAVESQGKPAAMTPAELDKLKQVEDRLGVVLVAHER
jgi:hypothetical protein